MKHSRFGERSLPDDQLLECGAPRRLFLRELDWRASSPDGSGRRFSAARARNGFTLIEILLVIAVIALLSSLFVTGVAVLAARDEGTLDEVFEQAVREARWLALDGERPVVLGFDEDKNAFVLSREAGGEAMREFPVDSAASIRFLKQRPRTSYVLIRGELVQTEPVESVTFFPDGSSTPFTIELGYAGDRWSYPIDPWTGAPLPRRPPP